MPDVSSQEEEQPGERPSPDYEFNEADFDFKITPGRGGVLGRLGEIWRFRELFYFLVWKDVKVKYKQAGLGILWAIISPFVSMVVYTVIFGKMIGIDQEIKDLYDLDPSWYPVFLYTALLPWNYFSRSLNRAGLSLVGSSNLITKVYFPRVIIPGAAALSGMVDFFFAALVMAGLMLYFGAVPGLTILAMIPLLGLLYLAVLSVGLLFAAVNVRYRDAGFMLGFVISLWLYLTPVIYPIKLFVTKFPAVGDLIYLNPMTGVIEGFRWAILGSSWPFPGRELLYSLAIILGLLVVSNWYFHRVERSFADVI